MQLKIDRFFSMPNHRTFLMKPVDEFIREHLVEGVILDPFANRPSDYGAITNDLNLESNVDHNFDALEFLKMYPDQSVSNILFDPPYSLRQLKECYNGIGRALTHHESKHFFSDLKNEISRVLRSGGVCISFGWNSTGIGKSRGMKMKHIRLVYHGGIHNDTLCMAEEKI